MAFQYVDSLFWPPITEMAPATQTMQSLGLSASYRLYVIPMPEITISYNRGYRITAKPSTTTAITVVTCPIPNGYVKAQWSGTYLTASTQRQGTGAWTDNGLNFVNAGFRISALSDSATSGGGGISKARLMGGM